MSREESLNSVADAIDAVASLIRGTDVQAPVSPRASPPVATNAASILFEAARMASNVQSPSMRNVSQLYEDARAQVMRHGQTTGTASTATRATSSESTGGSMGSAPGSSTTTIQPHTRGLLIHQTPVSIASASRSQEPQSNLHRLILTHHRTAQTGQLQHQQIQQARQASSAQSVQSQLSTIRNMMYPGDGNTAIQSRSHGYSNLIQNVRSSQGPPPPSDDDPQQQSVSLPSSGSSRAVSLQGINYTNQQQQTRATTGGLQHPFQRMAFHTFQQRAMAHQTQLQQAARHIANQASSNSTAVLTSNTLGGTNDAISSALHPGRASIANTSLSNSSSGSSSIANTVGMQGGFSRFNAYSSARIHPSFRTKSVYRLKCRYCNQGICKRGMKAILLADTRVELYSTDVVPPGRVQLVAEDYMTRNCHCRIRDVVCLCCGNAVGYHVTQPCELCMSACNNGHFWMFHSDTVEANERIETSGRILLWGHLPQAEADGQEPGDHVGVDNDCDGVVAKVRGRVSDVDDLAAPLVRSAAFLCAFFRVVPPWTQTRELRTPQVATGRIRPTTFVQIISLNRMEETQVKLIPPISKLAHAKESSHHTFGDQPALTISKDLAPPSQAAMTSSAVRRKPLGLRLRVPPAAGSVGIAATNSKGVAANKETATILGAAEAPVRDPYADGPAAIIDGPAGLFLGSAATAACLQRLAAASISVVLNVAKELDIGMDAAPMAAPAASPGCSPSLSLFHDSSPQSAATLSALALFETPSNLDTNQFERANSLSLIAESIVPTFTDVLLSYLTSADAGSTTYESARVASSNAALITTKAESESKSTDLIALSHPERVAAPKRISPTAAEASHLTDADAASCTESAHCADTIMLQCPPHSAVSTIIPDTPATLPQSSVSTTLSNQFLTPTTLVDESNTNVTHASILNGNGSTFGTVNGHVESVLSSALPQQQSSLQLPPWQTQPHQHATSHFPAPSHVMVSKSKQISGIEGSTHSNATCTASTPTATSINDQSKDSQSLSHGQPTMYIASTTSESSTMDSMAVDRSGFRYHKLAWSHNQDMAPTIEVALQLIQQAHDEGRSVLVHCQQGVSRSAALAIAFIMKSQGCRFNEAYERVKSRSPHISPNVHLVAQLVEFEQRWAAQK